MQDSITFENFELPIKNLKDSKNMARYIYTMLKCEEMCNETKLAYEITNTFIEIININND